VTEGCRGESLASIAPPLHCPGFQVTQLSNRMSTHGRVYYLAFPPWKNPFSSPLTIITHASKLYCCMPLDHHQQPCLSRPRHLSCPQADEPSSMPSKIWNSPFPQPNSATFPRQLSRTSGALPWISNDSWLRVGHCAICAVSSPFSKASIITPRLSKCCAMELPSFPGSGLLSSSS